MSKGLHRGQHVRRRALHSRVTRRSPARTGEIGSPGPPGSATCAPAIPRDAVDRRGCYDPPVRDPVELTFETLATDQRERFGPAWRTAVEAGIDVTLLERNRHLNPAQRLAQLDDMLELWASKQP